MKTLTSSLLLVDQHDFPVSTTLTCFHATLSAAFRQTRRGRKHNASFPPLSSSFSSSGSSIRKPPDRNGNGFLSYSPSTSKSSSPPLSLSSSREMELFLELIPSRLRTELLQHDAIADLIEVVLDLGRKPIARFPSGDWVLSEEPVKLEDLNHAISKVGDFSDDNRSGINHSLHRISAIRNRKLQIIGLTCRVGRAISGTAEMVHDLIAEGGSILVIGRPGVGKTTLIREIARMLADEHLKRVIIIDTSNEIGGDGDVPHSGIGRARRMQVPNVNLQHNVMIEAVENHMPETIIIDEIGTELEALAASTIAQRGVQLVGTAHGMTIDNVIKNPSLQILVGGIESVTLGDEEARKRKVQKSILERKGPPAFTCAVEMISKTEYRVHHKLDATVDAILAGKSPLVEVRRMDVKVNDSVSSTLETGKQNPGTLEILDNRMDIKVNDSVTFAVEPEKQTLEDLEIPDKYQNNIIESTEDDMEYPARRVKGSTPKPVSKRTSPVCVYTYKILEADLMQVAEVMGLDDEIDIIDDIGIADAILASSSELKQNPWIRSVAKFHKLPIFVIKANTMAHMVKAVRMILGMESFGSLTNRSLSHPATDIEIEDDAPQRKPSLEEIDALEEVRLAIEYIVIPGGEAVELLPRRSEIIDRQMELVKSYKLSAEKSGTDLNARLQILPLKLSKNICSVENSGLALTRQREITLDLNRSNGGGDGDDDGGGGTSVARLPFLPGTHRVPSQTPQLLAQLPL